MRFQEVGGSPEAARTAQGYLGTNRAKGCSICLGTGAPFHLTQKHSSIGNRKTCRAYCLASRPSWSKPALHHDLSPFRCGEDVCSFLTSPVRRCSCLMATIRLRLNPNSSLMHRYAFMCIQPLVIRKPQVSSSNLEVGSDKTARS